MTYKPNPNQVSYRLKQFITSIAFFIPIIVLGQIAENTVRSGNKIAETISSETTAKNNLQNIVSTNEVNPANKTSLSSLPDSEHLKIKATIEKHIRAVEGSERFIESNNNTEGVVMAISMMDATASVIQEGINSGNKEIVLLAKKLEKMAINAQEVNLPKLRAIYGNFLKEKLGDHNFTVTVLGNKKTELSFTNHSFADNKNISMFQDNLSSMLHLTRFKQITYRWSNHANDYKSHILNTPPDDKIVHHRKQGSNYKYY